MKEKKFLIAGIIILLSMFFFLEKSIFYLAGNHQDELKTFSEKSQNSSEEKKKKQIDELKRVALSFDDGPNPSTTPQLLNILKEKQVCATFFVLGENTSNCPEIVKQIKKEGHEIGSHTYDHQDLSQISIEEIQLEVLKTDEILEKIIGEKATFLRPPYGSITDLGVRLINRPIIAWSVDSEDWKTRDAEQIFQKIKETVYNGSILLFHDIYPETVSIIPKIIDYLHEQGYQLTSVGALLNYPKEARIYYGKGDSRLVTS